MLGHSPQRSKFGAVQPPSRSEKARKRWLVALGCVIFLAGIMYGTRAWIRTELIPHYAHELSEQSLEAALRGTITDTTHAGIAVELPSKAEVVCSASWADGVHTTTDCSTGFGPLVVPTSPKLNIQELEQSGWSEDSPDVPELSTVVARKQYGSVSCDLYYMSRSDGVSEEPIRYISAHCQRLMRTF